MRGKQIEGWIASIISAGCELQEGPSLFSAWTWGDKSQREEVAQCVGSG